MDTAHDKDENKVKQLPTTLERNSENEKDSTDLTFNATMDESSEENRKNPMLLSPVIRSVLKFLNIEGIKKCRLVSREWSSAGKIELGKRSLISLYNRKYSHSPLPPRLLEDFQACFLNSATLFSAFDIVVEFTKEQYVSESRRIEKFFDEQQKSIKELSLKFVFPDENVEKTVDMSSWIAKSPMVQKDVKQMTKLSIETSRRSNNLAEKLFNVPPLHLIGYIKDVSLVNCRINLEKGIQIFPIKLHLYGVTFYQDGIKLDEVRINDFVDLGRAKELSLQTWGIKPLLDLRGNINLKNVNLSDVQIENGESSQWVIERLDMTSTRYSLHNRMQIKEISFFMTGPIDLFTLPVSLQKLSLHDDGYLSVVSCSQPIVWENLQYLHIFSGMDLLYEEYSFPAHFVNCPQLTHLKLVGLGEMEMKSLWMPKSLKTLILQDTSIIWIADDDSHLNIEKLVIYDCNINDVKGHCENKIRMNDLVVYIGNLDVDKDLVDFLEYRKRLTFGKRFYIGELKWNDLQIENSLLKEYFDVKSSFYFFENGEKGRDLSEEAFFDLIPKHAELA